MCPSRLARLIGVVIRGGMCEEVLNQQLRAVAPANAQEDILADVLLMHICLMSVLKLQMFGHRSTALLASKVHWCISILSGGLFMLLAVHRDTNVA